MVARWSTLVLFALAGCADHAHVAAATRATPARASDDGPGATAGDGEIGDVPRDSPAAAPCVAARLVDAGRPPFVVTADTFYWLVYSAPHSLDGFFSAPKSGGTPTLVAPSHAERFVGVTMTHDREVSFYAESGDEDGGGGFIARVDPDGTTAIWTSPDPSLYYIAQVVADGGELFYGGDSYRPPPCAGCTAAIAARPTPGGDERIVARATHIDTIVLDGGYVYFTDSSVHGVFRVARSGGTPQRVATIPLQYPEYLSVADGVAYVGDHYAGQVVRAPFDGQGASIIWAAPTADTRLNTIVARGGRVYVGSSAGLDAMDYDGGNALHMLDSWVGALAFDGDSLYVAGDGIRRVCP